MNKEVLRLAGLLACLALAASRLGLVAHEVVAHGGMALAWGARVTAVQMFWFGGGWIRYALGTPSLAAAYSIAMAGIALELVIGCLVWICVRGDTQGRRLVRGIGIALLVHATWYLATGAFHGFGDGLILYRTLGDARVAVAAVAGLATCTLSYLGAKAVHGTLVAALPGSRRARVVGLLVAVVLGAGLHAALTIGELRIRRDVTYAQTMQPERERVIARALSEWQRDQTARGIEPTAEARRAQQQRIAREHRTFPFVWLLAAATLASVVAGAWRSRRRDDERVSTRLLARMFVAALASVWLVILIDGLLPG